jgi:chemotaxis protein MotB
MVRKMAVGFLGIVFGLVGCVTTKTYKRSQAETATCLTEKQAQAEQIDALNKDKAALIQDKAALTQAEADKEAELAKLKGTYDEVVGNLKNEISSGQIQVTQLKDKLTLNMVEKILFNSGQAEVKESGKKVLDSIAAALKNVQDKDIRVEGYTDNVPLSPKLTDRFPTNWELSTARATNVVRYLVEKDGLDPSHLIAAGFGQYHPISTNDTPEGRAQNRRIDIVLVPHEVSGSAASAHMTQAAVQTSTPTVPSPVQEGTPRMVPAQ